MHTNLHLYMLHAYEIFPTKTVFVVTSFPLMA